MSKIEVDAITEQSGSTLTTGGGAGKTVVVDATTVTLGRCGGTVALASGASQTGFGRTGTVDWQTGSIKTATFTAANGEGYFCNTSGGAFTVNLPAGSAGAIVSVSDYTRTFQTNNLTVAPNGSEKVGGVQASAILSTEGQSATFVYVDGTEGWINIQETSNSVTGNTNLIATGGTITTCGNNKIHTFTGPGTFTVSQVSACAADNTVSYMVVAAGGGGGGGIAGGGGAGGFREVKTPLTPYTASPLDGYPSAPNRITVTAAAFPITVGGGGSGGACVGSPASGGSGGNGNPSIFSTITSTGGGGGGGYSPNQNGNTGGSGGGGSSNASGGNGNTPSVSPAQGFGGGNGAPDANSTGAGGGGGASAVGLDGVQSPSGGAQGGNGGAGVTTGITGSSVARGGGGGGGLQACRGVPNPSQRGIGGTGGGGCGGASPYIADSAGTANTGGGGGASGMYGPGGNNGGGSAGGSGIVVIRYKFQ